MEIPVTSVSLLRDLAKGAAATRWTEFYRRYEPAMRSYLFAKFPFAEADDIIQESVIALMNALPEYRYTPDSNGHFRNYLVGIVRHKALDAVRRDSARKNLKAGLADSAPGPSWYPEEDQEEYDRWRHSAMEAALDQVLADESISSRTREVFRHVALMHEPPEDVARQFGISRNGVDQIKSRMIARLAKLVSAMTA